ncbi:MAG: hypothetical protein N3B21_02655 [Clostridia bacterium]|nr:hypothetical protein [Clostridia bacterium]
MKMNFFILLFISLPEAICNLAIILLLAGKKECLKMRGSNIARFSVALVSMLAISWFIRPLLPNYAVNFIVHSLAYTLI